jgi:hypothetical protein
LVSTIVVLMPVSTCIPVYRVDRCTLYYLIHLGPRLMEEEKGHSWRPENFQGDI